MYAVITSIQYCTGVLANAIWQREQTKHTHVGEEALKLPLSAADAIMYIENSKELLIIKKLLKLISDLSICNLKLYLCHPKIDG